MTFSLGGVLLADDMGDPGRVQERRTETGDKVITSNPDGVYNYVVDTNFESKISQIAGYTGFDDTASFPCVPWFERGSDNPGCVNQTISKRAVSLNASEDAV